MERPWYELVTSLTETTAKVCETLGDYGFKHGYESDTESVKVKTSSCATQFGLSQEDELDEFHNSQPSGLEAEKGNGRLEQNPRVTFSQKNILISEFNTSTGNQSAKTPVHETTADALQEAHLLKLAATEPETGMFNMCRLLKATSTYQTHFNVASSIVFWQYCFDGISHPLQAIKTELDTFTVV